MNKRGVLWVIMMVVCCGILCYVIQRYRNADAAEQEICGRELVASNDDTDLYLLHYLSGGDFPDDDFLITDNTYMIRYKDNRPADSCSVIGPYRQITGDGSLCKIIVGIDTVFVDITKPLPKTIDIRFAGELSDCRNYSISRHFHLNDSAPTMDFQIHLGVPDGVLSDSVLQFLSHLICEKIESQFSTCNGRQIAPFKMDGKAAGEMLDYYYSEFCRLYRQSFSTKDELVNEISDWERIHSMQLIFTPIWMNEDRTLLTYRCSELSARQTRYCFNFERYMTVDIAAMRILDWTELGSEEECGSLLTKYEKELYLDTCEKLRLYENNSLSDVYYNAYAPFPAIVGDRMIICYQKYYKGQVEDGAMYFTEPYDASHCSSLVKSNA